MAKLTSTRICSLVLFCCSIVTASVLCFELAAVPFNRNKVLAAPKPSPTPTTSPTPTPITIEILPYPTIGNDPVEPSIDDIADGLFGGRDIDCDGVRSVDDNCPFTYNPNQKDKDKNGIGDACDGINKGKQEFHCDKDGDGVLDYRDNCPLVCNPEQEDKNKNKIGDVCDPELLKTWVRLSPCPKVAQKKHCRGSKQSIR
jgi:hypothetical protein